MPVRIVEGQKPYTGGPGIEIDANKVISLLLREENNLIYINDNDEAYVDLQFASGLTPQSDFPVGVTVGKVLQSDGWTKSGLVLNRKTTSGDYARWIYANDGELYFDKGTGVRNQVYYSSEVDALFSSLRSELSTVAFTGDYNDLINKPAFLQEQADWEEEDPNAPSYIQNKPELAEVATTGDYDDLINTPTIPTVNNATLTIQKNGTTVKTFTANASSNVTANITVPTKTSDLTNDSGFVTSSSIPTVNNGTLTIQKNGTQVATFSANQSGPTTANITVPGVQNNTSSTSTSDALSANMGKELQDQINNLQSRGRFLSNWNATTGLPTTNPTTLPYTYHSGDYFIVTAVGATNYRPSGTSYTGAASTTVESETLNVGDMYVFDSTDWLLQINTARTIVVDNALSPTSTNPVENRVINSALGNKADTSSLATVATSGSYNDLSNKPTIGTATITIQKNGTTVNSFGVNATSNKSIDISVPTKTSDITNDSGFITGISSSDVTTALGYTPANDSNVVKTSGNQTIAGTKTFSTSPVVPSKTSAATNTGTAIATEAQVYKKQDTLVSGTNIKTVNNTSLLGSGNVAVQPTLVSGTNIKTINSNSLLGSGDISISEFSATNGGVKIFDMPSVNGNMSAIIEWLTGGGEVILRYIVNSIEHYFRVTKRDGTNRTMQATLCGGLSGISSGEVTTTASITYSAAGVATTVNYSDVGFVPSSGTIGYVLTKTANGSAWSAPSGGDVMVSSQSGNILTSGMKIWAGTQTNYDGLSSYDSNTVYLTVE